MLIAIIDCLVVAELQTLIDQLTRDGIVCVASNTDICWINDTLAGKSAQPIVIFGDESMHIPVDDCPRIWLCCGPEISTDENEAWAFHAINDPGILERKHTAIKSGFRCMTYVDVLCFVANEQAKQCVKNMALDEKAANIVLRHVKKPTSYIG